MSNSIYSTSYDHDMKAVVLYTGTDETLGEDRKRLYIDEARTEGASMELVRNLFVRGMLVIDFGDNEYGRPNLLSYGNFGSSRVAIVTVGEADYYAVDESGTEVGEPA